LAISNAGHVQKTSAKGVFRDAAKVALVTGAGGAIGSAIAARLAAAGSGIVVADLKADSVRELVETLAARYEVPVLGLAADLSVPEAAADMVAMIEAEAGRLDHLINNAGLNRPFSLEAMALADWESVFAINLRAPMLLAKAAIPLWRQQAGGAIVNIGSRVWVSGAVPAYTASKAGLVGLTRSLAVELGPLNVTANVVAPSFVDTPFTRQNRSEDEIAAMHDRVRQITPIPRLGLAEDIAGAVAYLVSPEAGYVTGEVLHVCGGSQLAARPTAPIARER
jgi:NAD(P)-dependent dehydrogenase (short-subunit alcohol dehydrogenase family)